MDGAGAVEDEGEQSALKIPEEFQIIESSQSRELFQTLLETYYIPLEVWYTRIIVDKVISQFISRLGNSNPVQAHRLSSSDLSQPQVITTTPDDVFYFLKVILTRMLSTGSTMAVEKTTEDMESLETHSAVRNVMRLFDRIKDFEKRALAREERLGRADGEALLQALATLAQLLGPLAPHVAEELWISFGHDEDGAQAPWPGVSLELAA